MVVGRCMCEFCDSHQSERELDANAPVERLLLNAIDDKIFPLEDSMSWNMIVHLSNICTTIPTLRVCI